MYMRLGTAQTSLCIRTVSLGPLLLSYTLQMDGGIEVSLHKIYVSISILNKTLGICDKYQSGVCWPISGAEVFGVVCLGT